MFLLLFLNFDLHFLIPVVSVMPVGIPTNEAKGEIETIPITAEAEIIWHDLTNFFCFRIKLINPIKNYPRITESNVSKLYLSSYFCCL